MSKKYTFMVIAFRFSKRPVSDDSGGDKETNNAVGGKHWETQNRP